MCWLKIKIKPDIVAHTWNPNFSEDKDGEDCDSRLALAKS
jgi:hypothetical protein